MTSPNSISTMVICHKIKPSNPSNKGGYLTSTAGPESLPPWCAWGAQVTRAVLLKYDMRQNRKAGI